MRPASLTVLLAANLIAWTPLASCCQDLVANGSFETVSPDSSSDAYTVLYGTLATNAVANWIFGISGGGAYDGIVSSQSEAYFGKKVVEDGSNAAFFQGVGFISQTVTLNAGTYKLTFYAMSRVPFGPNTILVSLGDLLSERFTPTNTTQVKTNDWIPYTYNFIVPTAGFYVLRFSGTIPFVRFSSSIPFSSGSDYTTYINNVSIVPLVGPNSRQMSNGGAISNVASSLPLSDIVFVGDSITAGATLSNPALESATTQCAQSLGQQYSVAVRMSNQGHGGHTTVDWLPSSDAMSDFHSATTAAGALVSNQPGQLVFSIMLGANDSAQSGHPVRYLPRATGRICKRSLTASWPVSPRLMWLSIGRFFTRQTRKTARSMARRASRACNPICQKSICWFPIMESAIRVMSLRETNWRLVIFPQTT